MARRRTRSSVRLGLPALAVLGVLVYFFPELAPYIRTVTEQHDSPQQARTTSSPTPHATPAIETGRGNTRIDSFNEAKRKAAVIFAGQPEFYCGCQYEGKEVDLASCGYEVKSDANRATRLEWEHVVPAHDFGRAFPKWRDGHPKCVDSKGNPFKGRNCARKVSKVFRLMEADLYNLQPAIGEVNGRRSNLRMGMVEGENREFGACDLEIDTETGRVEPRPAIRGDVARTYRYMQYAYGVHLIPDAMEQLFAAWEKEDPVDDWERERAKQIHEIQGNSNPFIK